MKFSIIIFILNLWLIVNVVNVVSTSEVECNRNEQVSEYEQQKLKLQTDNTNLKLEIFKLREENQILLNEGINCTEFSNSAEADKEKNKWLTVLRRVDGSVDFDRPWQDYKVGFGNIAGNFFLGLENIYQLTAHQCHELMVILKDFDDVEKYANYDHFRIGSEAEDYSLNVLGKYSGTAGDAFRPSESMKFSTYDRDNDKWSSVNCAKAFHGGWWHNNCGPSKLTGVYQTYSHDDNWSGIEWQTWYNHYSFKFAKIMVRPTTCW